MAEAEGDRREFIRQGGDDSDERSREEQMAVAGDIDAFLRDGGARPWQLELAVPVLAEALTSAAPT